MNYVHASYQRAAHLHLLHAQSHGEHIHTHVSQTGFAGAGGGGGGDEGAADDMDFVDNNSDISTNTYVVGEATNMRANRVLLGSG